jgi:hypothetical protein
MEAVMRRRTIYLAFAALAPAGALSADGSLQQARACAAIQDSLQRLVCYDRVFAPSSAPAAAAPAPAPDAAPAAPPPADSRGSFGADQLKRTEAERKATSELRTLTAAVSQVRETRPGVFRVTLESGQVWQQMDMDSTFEVAVGDTVQIDRGRLGGYRMARTSKGGSGWVRVNRLK